MTWRKRKRSMHYSGVNLPFLSSTKGAFGHALAAAGAIGSAISVMSIAHHLIPANSGCEVPDPELNLHPVMVPLKAEVKTVLSNAFGFGEITLHWSWAIPKNHRADATSTGRSLLFVYWEVPA